MAEYAALQNALFILAITLVSCDVYTSYVTYARHRVSVSAASHHSGVRYETEALSRYRISLAPPETLRQL